MLTFDDGWDSLKNILLWLNEQKLKVTLFLNPAYLLQEEKREKGLSIKLLELEDLLSMGEGNIHIASHGWTHKYCTELTMSEFEENVRHCESFLSKYESYIPFFAYPCGRYTNRQNHFLKSTNIVPVFMDGEKNYNDTFAIHRELLD